MPRDILSQFGRGSSQPQASSASCGGVLPGETKDVRNYREPQGPKGIMQSQSPGLHGHNCGPGGSQGSREYGGGHGGSPGIGGTNHGNKGSQGSY